MTRHYKKRKRKNDVDFHDFQKLEGFSFKPESKWRLFLNILLITAMIAFSILIWL